LVGCGGSGGTKDKQETDSLEALVIYSGRNERLIGPLLERFSEQTGVPVEVRYGGTSELLATLIEEGANSPADVFISQDAGALGALSARGMLRPLPPALLDRLPAAFRSAHGNWVGLSGRARVVVFNPELIDRETLPKSLNDVTAERYRGKFGVAPTNASFQAHAASFRALNGEGALTDLLNGIAANEPRRYSKNSPIVEAVIAGEIEWGLVNHYYLWRVLQERPDAPARNYFMTADDGSRFVNMAGAGAISDRGDAEVLLQFLVSDVAQKYFAEETYEYPLVPGVPPAVDLPPLDDDLPQIDYQRVSDALEPTLKQIHDSGLLSFN
jgi:iron(III) transport system substrate-binding protein